MFVGSSSGTDDRNRSGQVFRKPIGRSGAEESRFNSVCHVVKMPVKPSCMLVIGSGVLSLTNVGV